MLNSSVASLPAYNNIAFSPPGWSGKNLVTSSTCPLTMTQQSSLDLCAATSATEYSPPADFFSSTTSSFFSCEAAGEEDDDDADEGVEEGVLLDEVPVAGRDDGEGAELPAQENERSTFPCSGLIVIVVDNGAPR